MSNSLEPISEPRNALHKLTLPLALQLRTDAVVVEVLLPLVFVMLVEPVAFTLEFVRRKCCYAYPCACSCCCYLPPPLPSWAYKLPTHLWYSFLTSCVMSGVGVFANSSRPLAMSHAFMVGNAGRLSETWSPELSMMTSPSMGLTPRFRPFFEDFKAAHLGAGPVGSATSAGGEEVLAAPWSAEPELADAGQGGL